jgi:hypothetical protein
MIFYSTGIKYHVKTLWNQIEIVFSGNIFILLFANFNIPERILPGFLIANASLFLFLVLPTLIKYFRFIKLSKNILIVVDNEKKQITIQNNNQSKRYMFDEIKNISRICTEKAGNRKNTKPQWGDLFYFVVELKTKEEIIVTSLMTDVENLEIDGKETIVEPYGNGWISLEGRNIINLQLR